MKINVKEGEVGPFLSRLTQVREKLKKNLAITQISSLVQ